MYLVIKFYIIRYGRKESLDFNIPPHHSEPFHHASDGGARKEKTFRFARVHQSLRSEIDKYIIHRI